VVAFDEQKKLLWEHRGAKRLKGVAIPEGTIATSIMWCHPGSKKMFKEHGGFWGAERMTALTTVEEQLNK